MKSTTAIRITAVFGFLAVALGAMGAHGLEGALRKSLDPAQVAKQLGWWHTAVQYHLFHAIAMLAIAMREPFLKCAWWLLAGGIAVFSGTLYIMGATGNPWLGRITPIGGVLFLAGWLVLCIQAGRKA
jgi:uncharacterized membrane protein YgdD (TMEM256/DUF423 family)